jgi:DHA1 family tetracycline resistance protein-like MFS transporter
MASQRNASMGFIFATLLIDVTGIGIIIPVIPKLIEEVTGTSMAMGEIAKYGGWLMFAYSIMQFLFSPLLGNLSDRYGRRPILLLSLLGLGLDYIVMALAPSLWWLFVGRVIAGIMGASFTTATAYIADISTPEKRAQNFGMVGAAFGLGFIIGPVLGGVLGQFGPRVPFYAAAALSLLNFLYGFFFLPESLPQENRRAFDWKRANPIGSLKQLFKHPVIAGMIGSMFLVYVASFSVQGTWSYYTMLKFGWDEKMVGYSLGAVGLLVAVVQGGLIRYINPRLGSVNSVYVGLMLYVVGFLAFAFAASDVFMFLALVPYCLGGISGPALQGIMSGAVPANEQGELQGSFTGLLSVTSIIGPPLMTSVFGYYSSAEAPFYFPGAPFILGAILGVVSLVLAWNALKSFKE